MAGSALEEDASFRLGELFDSYEDLERKLERFSKQSLVHYWRRDSRTVSGAHMKTARPISERLKYYSVKYACIYGGQKFLPRGAGRRQSQSIRTNCPAHIMLRASKDGTKLEVTSVNNEHNHEISEELFKKLPQERKLCGEIKQEVQDLMQLHIDRKRLKEYVRLRTNKVLRSKDLFNIAAANKLKRDITPERAYQLFKRIHDLEKLQRREGTRGYSGESEDEIAQTIKRIKKEQESPWGQDRLSAEVEGSEVNECEYSAHRLHHDEEEEEEEEEEGVVDDIVTSEGQLLGANTAGDIITANGEIVGDLVMEDGDPSVIVESIVNADGSVFVDERDFNNYCNNHLTRDGESPGTQVLEIESMAPQAVEIEKISRVHGSVPSSPTDHHHHHHQHHHHHHNHNNNNNHRENEGRDSSSQSNEKTTCVLSNDCADSRIWIMKEAAAMETDGDSGPESETNRPRNDKNTNENEVSEVVLSEEASHQLLQEQLAVLRAEQRKLYHETEMLKLKKDKLRLQMNCYSNEIRKQEMEKEKLRLEIKLLQSKVVEDANDVSHYIFVP